MRVSRLIAVWLLAACLAVACASCGGDGDGEKAGATGSTATQDDSGLTLELEGDGESEDADKSEGDSPADDSEDEGPARSKEVDELLGMHPIFPTKRFMNFAARGNPGACSLLSAKGRKAMEAAHGTSCEKTIRSAAAAHDEPGLVIYGEFVPIEEFSNLDYLATIFVLEKERARITISNQRPPFRLSRYGKVWLLDAVPLTEVGTIG